MKEFGRAHSMTKHLWKLGERRLINVGGLRAVVFLLIRTMLD
ncbi:hypothetical protein J437_LFUL006981 [Ladona fulva]|uniref:Uncharacterized protein n=1 Tax=Ladona fulva TaxID=123851 RepID=A0A8K0K5J9_LADFU|nr:hypothetical protein J437_LFUL006981 [Ladona fulva]